MVVPPSAVRATSHPDATSPPTFTSTPASSPSGPALLPLRLPSSPASLEAPSTSPASSPPSPSPSACAASPLSTPLCTPSTMAGSSSGSGSHPHEHSHSPSPSHSPSHSAEHEHPHEHENEVPASRRRTPSASHGSEAAAASDVSALPELGPGASAASAPVGEGEKGSAPGEEEKGLDVAASALVGSRTSAASAPVEDKDISRAAASAISGRPTPSTTPSTSVPASSSTSMSTSGISPSAAATSPLASTSAIEPEPEPEPEIASTVETQTTPATLAQTQATIPLAESPAPAPPTSTTAESAPPASTSTSAYAHSNSSSSSNSTTSTTSSSSAASSSSNSSGTPAPQPITNSNAQVTSNASSNSSGAGKLRAMLGLGLGWVNSNWNLKGRESTDGSSSRRSLGLKALLLPSTSASASASAYKVQSHSKTLSKTSTTSNALTPASQRQSEEQHQQQQEAQYLAVRPRVPGVFTPSLPLELWLLILKYATYPPFVTPQASSNKNGTVTAYPYPYPYPTASGMALSTSLSPSSPSSTPSSAPSSTPISFLSHAPAHTHLPERRAQYAAQLRFKASLTRVCRVWNAVGQEVLWEWVWIGSAREGREVAARLDGDLDLEGGVVFAEVNAKMKGKKAKGKRASRPTSTSTVGPRTPKIRRSATNPGQYIRHLHIETRALDRASPHDVLLILQRCPLLEVFADYGSVRRPAHPMWVEGGEVVPFGGGVGGGGRARDIQEDEDGLDVLEDGDGDEGDEGYKHPFAPHTPYALAPSPAPLAPDALLSTLLSRPLKRLTWTNYEHDGGADVARGVRFYASVVEPRLRAVGGGLEFLEVVLSAGGCHGMGGREGWGWGVSGADHREYIGGVGLGGAQALNLGAGGVGGPSRWGYGHGLGGGRGARGKVEAEALAERKRKAEREIEVQRERAMRSAGVLRNPAAGVYGAANLLTELTANYTSTATSTTTSLDALPAGGEPALSIDGVEYTLHLPALRALKVTLDSATFAVLARWCMPALTHLSVVAADFAYAGKGFRRFFEVHGMGLVQLELGHSTGEIEEAWVTERTGGDEDSDSDSDEEDEDQDDNGGGGGNGGNGRPRRPLRIPLDAWCPNLTEFICSANAEWHWQSPDWIAPHVLLPAHAGLEFIGVRDIERRLVGDMDEAVRRRRGAGGGGHGAGGNEEGGGEEDPYFMLLEQFGSLLRREAFPRLRYVRDMSWESDVIRRTGRMVPAEPPVSTPSPSTTTFGTGTGNALGVGITVSALAMTLPTHNPNPNAANKWLNASSWPFAFSHPSMALGSSSTSAKKQVEADAALDAAARAQGRTVLRFWAGVLERCRARGVWLEDCRGVNVTSGDLRRAAGR